MQPTLIFGSDFMPLATPQTLRIEAGAAF